MDGKGRRYIMSVKKEVEVVKKKKIKVGAGTGGIGMSPLTTISPAMSRLLDASGKSLNVVSRESGVDRAHICRIFSGQRNPGLDTANKISGVLGCELGELYDAIKEDQGAGQ